MIGAASTRRESSVYQRILNEGRTEGHVDGERRLLIRMARAKFGPASEAAVARLGAVADPDELDRLGVGLLAVATWDELLDG